jgi:HAD superfamily hydrolase (TIGR01509 family)
MSEVKVVVFDLGNVLVNFDYSIAIRNFLRHCPMPEADLNQLVNQSPLLQQFESNQLSPAQFYAEICTASGFCGTFEQFREAFCEIFSPAERMIELHAQLRQAGLLTYIFSNTNKLQAPYIRDRFPFFSTFHAYILSCDHGAMKPHPRIYEVVENVSGCRAGELLYIDDREENIATGRARGWKTIHHQAPEETIARVRAEGLPV